MSKPLDDAIEVLRTLPENVQATVARAIFEFASSEDDERVRA